MKKQVVLVFGATGMLGHQVLKTFRAHPGYDAFGVGGRIAPLSLATLFMAFKPDVVINCAGVTPRHADFDDYAKVYAANSVFPHKLHTFCVRHNARLIQISTDCVFLGNGGGYNEKNAPLALDLYGQSKLLGEIDAPDALTIRTSFIGHELEGRRHGLLEWYLAGEAFVVTGYSRSIFSGLTTNEFAKVLRDHIVPNDMLHGTLHVGGEPISKYDLLSAVQAVYNTEGAIAKGQGPAVDRSLDSSRLRMLTGYQAPSWLKMIREMHDAR